MKIKLIENNKLDHKLWEKDLYTQKIDYIINSIINEYDMKRAGFNLSIYYGLLDDNIIKYLSLLPKDEQTRRIGLIRRDDRDFNKRLSKAFKDMRERFFIDNNIQEKHVLSIKKDAIFLINKTCDKTTYRNIEFILKNKYTSFHRFDKMEFYYKNNNRKLDVKGIKDEKLILHKKYMLSFLKDVFHTLEVSSNERVIYRIKKFASQYKTRMLSKEYYRELNSDSAFSLMVNDTNIKAIEYIDGYDIDYSYNYMTYILKLIQRYFFISD